MKQSIVLFLCLGVLASCGRKSSSRQEPEVLVQNEEQLGLTSHSECARAEEIRGSNFVYKWIKAKHGELQRFTIYNHEKKIVYDEARAGDFFQGEATYQYMPQEKKMVFKTTAKSLTLTFPQIPMGTIENVPSGRQYVVAVLTYEEDKFLCEIAQ